MFARRGEGRGRHDRMRLPRLEVSLDRRARRPGSVDVRSAALRGAEELRRQMGSPSGRRNGLAAPNVPAVEPLVHRMTPERLIRFQCARPDHHASPPAGAIGIVTLHDGKWAYCHSAAKDRHEWSEIEGTMLELLLVKEWRREPPSASRAPAAAPRPRVRASRPS